MAGINTGGISGPEIPGGSGNEVEVLGAELK